VVAIGIWIFASFVSAAVLKHRVPVRVPVFSDAYARSNTFASMKGTWVIEGEKQDFPLQTSSIICSAKTNHCTAATAIVRFGEELVLELDQYEIVEWTESRIVFVDDRPGCIRSSFTVDLWKKLVTELRERRAIPGCEKHPESLRLEMVSGWRVNRELEKDAMPWFGRFPMLPGQFFFR
jgi:hypothetical protein